MKGSKWCQSKQEGRSGKLYNDTDVIIYLTSADMPFHLRSVHNIANTKSELYISPWTGIT